MEAHRWAEVAKGFPPSHFGAKEAAMKTELKPHIKKIPRSAFLGKYVGGMWFCAADKSSGFGATPKEAYCAWVEQVARAKHMAQFFATIARG